MCVWKLFNRDRLEGSLQTCRATTYTYTYTRRSTSKSAPHPSLCAYTYVCVCVLRRRESQGIRTADTILAGRATKRRERERIGWCCGTRERNLEDGEEDSCERPPKCTCYVLYLLVVCVLCGWCASRPHNKPFLYGVHKKVKERNDERGETSNIIRKEDDERKRRKKCFFLLFRVFF